MFVKFDKKFQSRMHKFKKLHLPRPIRRQETIEFNRFPYDKIGGGHVLTLAEDRDYANTFHGIYAIAGERLYIQRDCFLDALIGKYDPTPQQLTTYKFLYDYSPIHLEAVYLVGGGLGPCVDAELFRERMLSSKQKLSVLSRLRILRIRSLLSEVEKTVLIRSEDKYLNEEYVMQLKNRHANILCKLFFKII